MSTYPLSTLAGAVGVTGFSAPTFEQILSSLIASTQQIMGSDIYLGEDSKLYELLALIASAINDSNNATLNAYNSLSPDFAVGAGLSRLVKLNGIQRQIPTNSTAVLTIVGVAGTTINNAVAVDQSGKLWTIPNGTVIPSGGSVSVTAVCQTIGAVSAAPSTINGIYTPVYGWQTVNNPSAAAVGAPVESDATLRARQAASVSLAAVTPAEAILAAIANVSGVTQSAIYVNNTSSTDSNGIPAHAISLIVQGGSISAIAQAIEQTKAPGVPTYGTTTVVVQDPAGLSVPINFFELSEVPIYVAITINPLTGYTSRIGTEIVAAIVSFINNLAIGADVRYSWIEGAAGLIGTADGMTFEIVSLTIGTNPVSLGTSDITIAFNQQASCAAANIALTV